MHPARTTSAGARPPSRPSPAAARIRAGVALAALAACAQPSRARPHVVFRIVLPYASASEPVSGRLFVMMTRSEPGDPSEPLQPVADPERVWIAAREVDGLMPGRSVEIDADSLAAPRGFSHLPGGPRWVMAALDADRNAAWRMFSPGDLLSRVERIDDAGTRAAPTTLALTLRVPPRTLPRDTSISLVEVPSPRLSAFWGRPVMLRAAVLLPPRAEAIATAAGPRFRAVYHVAPWGGSDLDAFGGGRRQVEQMRAGGERGAAHVFLDPTFPTGHPAFANSANNGPWADALVAELIPYLERRFGLIADARARFLTGHSSGGWATLWLQATRPDVFGGTWSTSPDPVDFADFTGVDVRPGSRDNFYRAADGSPHYAVRVDGRGVMTQEEYERVEMVLGPGGQNASFEAVFGPRAADGSPARLFDRRTGALDPAVERAWAAYDIHALLRREWPRTGPQLRGKLHVLVGGDDTFYLDGAVRRLCAFLRSVPSAATCEIVPGRGHEDLYEPFRTYPRGLDVRFGQEMQQQFAATWP